MKKNLAIKQFHELVVNKYHIYNSLFMNLPYEKMSKIGMWIPILANESEEGYAAGKNPVEIVDNFFDQANFKTEKEQIDFLFRVIQYVERQVVLFDAIEDASFDDINNLKNNKTIRKSYQLAASQGREAELVEKLKDFGIRIVFTAHPTQFYPPPVQRIIHDLQAAISKNEVNEINILLQQLGKTPFLNKVKPTPYDEARSIIYYLRYVYYDGIGKLQEQVKGIVGEDFDNTNLIQLGFWPGGDRDGNPFVTAETTRKVADELRMSLMKCYYHELKKIKRRLTFRSIEPILTSLSDKLYKNMFALDADLTLDEILEPLYSVRELLVRMHDGLFVEQLDNFITKVNVFKIHFATVDIRQDSRIHTKAIKEIITKYKLADKPYEELSEAELTDILINSNVVINEHLFDDELIVDTIKNIKQLKIIQKHNGEQGCNRYIISNSEDIFAVLHVYGLFRFCGWKEENITFDIVPLFETIKGLSAARETMDTLYNLPKYAQHLQRRGNKQTIMLGFSDGTKDGGYLKANWEIFRTKEILSQVSEENGIKVMFFDGRGGPPARGGGKTHRFYASQGKNIANHEIQLTIQGQTISSMYGTISQFMHNCEQLITAGVSNDIFENSKTKLDQKERELFEELGDSSFQKYEELKHHPKFIKYLEQMSTLKYYGRVNIGSRPGKRGNTKELTLSDLRAISFVGSWSQLKQNVPGYFGIGTAIAKLKEEGRIDEVKELFKESALFNSLIKNSMMSLTKTYFALTSYMKDHEEFGDFWQILYDEYKLSKDMMLEISGYDTLMQEEFLSKTSIILREQMVLPLLTIQQYALQKIAEGVPNQEIYESMVTRSLYGNINASRNSA